MTDGYQTYHDDQFVIFVIYNICNICNKCQTSMLYTRNSIILYGNYTAIKKK